MSKIDNLEKVLSDDKYLNEYIQSLENKEVCIPKDLNKNIMTKIKKKKNTFYLDICKIAACFIFTLSICQTDFMSNDRIGEYMTNKKIDNTAIEQKVSEICSVFTKPIDIGGEK